MPLLQFHNFKRETCCIALTDRNFRLFLKYKADLYSYDSYCYISEIPMIPDNMPQSTIVYQEVMTKLQELLPKYYCLHYRLKCWCSRTCTHDEKESVLLTRAQYRYFKVVYKLKINITRMDKHVWRCYKVEKFFSAPEGKLQLFPSVKKAIVGMLERSMTPVQHHTASTPVNVDQVVC